MRRRDAVPALAQPVRFYTRAGCPFSLSLAWKLRRRGVPLEFHDIWADEHAAAFVRSVARGNETVPTVVVGETVLVAPTARRVMATVRAVTPDPEA